MNKSKNFINKYVRLKGGQAFVLFYKFMRGGFDMENLSEEEKSVGLCVRNECTNPDGACYKYYEEIKKIRKTKNVERILHLQECILQVMCEKMFFNALKLKFVQRNELE